jgi:hypothetical protein
LVLLETHGAFRPGQEIQDIFGAAAPNANVLRLEGASNEVTDVEDRVQREISEPSLG